MIKINFKKISFQRKLFLILSITMVLLFIFNYGYFYSMFKDSLYRSARDDLAASIEQLTSNINAKLEYFVGLSNTIYSDYQIMQILTQKYVDPVQYVDLYQYLNKYVQRTLAADPYICSISFYTSNESISPDMQYIKPLQQFDDDGLLNKILKANGAVVYGPVKARSSTNQNSITNEYGNYSISIMRLMNYFTYGSDYGISSIEVDVRDFERMFDKELKSKNIYIVDSNGIIIASKPSSFISKPLSDVVNVARETLKDSDFMDIYQDEKQMLVFTRHLNNGWMVIESISYDNIIQDINHSLLKIFMISFVMLALAFFAIYAISSFFSRKINYLHYLIKEVELGHFNIEIANMGEDELGEVISAFGEMTNKINYLMKEVYEKELIKKSAELELLQAQITPHFLYNTLASIISLARRYRDERLIGMLTSLSSFYRISLNKGKKIVSVEEEMELTRNYAQIMMYRFEGLVRINFNYDSKISNYMTPKFILQPFVENSISHGISGDNGIDVYVSADIVDGKLMFIVEDNGSGMSQEPLAQCLKGPTKTGGYGIWNVQQRIMMLYGDNYGVHIKSTPGEGTKVTILLPIIEQG